VPDELEDVDVDENTGLDPADDCIFLVQDVESQFEDLQVLGIPESHPPTSAVTFDHQRLGTYSCSFHRRLPVRGTNTMATLPCD
jgi:hypothetical protein